MTISKLNTVSVPCSLQLHRRENLPIMILSEASYGWKQLAKEHLPSLLMPPEVPGSS